MARRSSSSRRLPNGSAPPSASAEAPAKPLARGNSGGGKKSGPWAEPSPAQIERAIRDSALPVVVSLEIATASESEPAPRLPLLECGLSSWQELVELQRAVESLERPTREGKDQQEEDALECMVFGSSAKPELQLSTSAVDSVHKVATTLLLRLQSLGFSVRSLLKDRVLVRLPAIAAPVNMRKLVHWDAIVVAPEATAEDDDSPDWIHRVMLPPVRLPENPLSHVRHPKLVPMVDNMLADHASSGRVHVVVLRGIPGSGKSSLGRDVVAICEARGARAVVCSADTYFETPRGYSFNVKTISKAHEASQRLFREALEEKQAAVIVVDNTHTQRWEYEVYEKAALERGAEVHVLEMHCPDVLTCQRMARRNSHGVSVVKVMAMYLRWDADDRATLFNASFQDALVLENPATRNPLKNYVAYVGLFLDATTRAQLLEHVHVRHANVVAEHITLFFRPTTQYIRQAPIGKKFKVRVTSVVEDDKGQALQVELDDRLPLRCMNKIPHITVSTAQGISAFYSNELLEDANAKRTQVEDVWELEVTLGIALMAQSRKIVSLASPLQHQFAEPERREDLTSASASTNGAAPGIDSLIVLDVEAAEIHRTSETIEHAVLRHALVRHSSGPHAASQRVVAVRNAADSDAKSEAKLLTALHAQLSPSWLPDALHFDSVMFLKAGETLATMVQQRSDNIKRVNVLTMRQASTVASELNGTGVCVTLKQLPRFGSRDRLERLAPSLDASLTRTLDAMWVSPTEEACFAVQKAIDVAESTLSECGVHGATVECLDSALWSLPASVVVIATATAVAECSTDDLVTAMKSVGVRDIAVVEDRDESIALQFQLSTKSTQTPIIRWRVARSASAASSISSRVEAIRVVRRWLRDSLTPTEHDLYSQMAGVVSAVLRGNVKPSIAQNTLNLLAERAVFAFFGSRSSMDVTLKEGKYLDHQLLWTCIQDCLRWLAQWTTQRWEAEIGAVMDPTEASAAKEIATLIHGVFQAAEEVVAAGSEANVGESTGTPAWGQKLWSILVLLDVQES